MVDGVKGGREVEETQTDMIPFVILLHCRDDREYTENHFGGMVFTVGRLVSVDSRVDC